MTFRGVLYTSVLVILLLCLSACGGKSNLMSLQLIPSTQTLNVAGETVQFQAIGTFQNKQHPPTTRDMTNECTWRTSNAAVVTISTSGVATAVGSGSATITASYETSGISATASVTVSDHSASSGSRDLVSISIIPNSQSLSTTGETAQFLAVGSFSGGAQTEFLDGHNLVWPLTWSSSAQQVATIDQSSGLATAVGVGTTTITAKAKALNGADISATATLSESGVPTPTVPLLTVVKLGAGANTGTVRSTPTTIDCGSTCSASFPLGLPVTLTAIENGRTFRGWSSNCVVGSDPKVCTVTMNINTVVGAIFD